MRYGELVLGPAGSGKSTYCRVMREHGAATRRRVEVVNLDPGAELLTYDALADVRALVTVGDVMEDEELGLGPNGALVRAMEFLVEEEVGWLAEALGEEEDLYVLFDCPGQMELYTHYDVMARLAAALTSQGFRLASVFVLDTHFLLEAHKFMAGSLTAMAAMLNLQLPAVNVLSKMDLLSKAHKATVHAFLDPETRGSALQGMGVDEGPGGGAEGGGEGSQGPSGAGEGSSEARAPMAGKLGRLTRALAGVLDDYSLLSLVPLDISDEESVAEARLLLDATVQYGEDEDVRDRFPEQQDAPDEMY